MLLILAFLCFVGSIYMLFAKVPINEELIKFYPPKVAAHAIARAKFAMRLAGCAGVVITLLLLHTALR